MYKEKDSEARAQFWLAEGNASRSAQLTGLGKFMLYEIRVLAFTRIGDGVPSRPPVLERTLDDGGCRRVGEQKDTNELRGSVGCQEPSRPTPWGNPFSQGCHSQRWGAGPVCAVPLRVIPISPSPVPGPPVGILFPEVRTTSVQLIWQPPAAPNGIILGRWGALLPALLCRGCGDQPHRAGTNSWPPPQHLKATHCPPGLGQTPPPPVPREGGGMHRVLFPSPQPTSSPTASTPRRPTWRPSRC